MNILLLVAGAIAFVAAAIHGIAGDALVRAIDVGGLPASPFGGGPAAIKQMIRVAWHMLTATFVLLGGALVVCGLDDAHEACRRIGILAASAFSVFAAIAIASALHHEPRALLRHPAPVSLLAIAVLAWWGTL
jgi:hypothetical protein